MYRQECLSEYFGSKKMNAVTEKLKRTKSGYRNGYYEDGNADGLQWAKEASHDELKYVVQEYETTNERIRKHGISVDYYPTKDSVLGVYFSKKMEVSDGMCWKTTTQNHCVPNGYSGHGKTAGKMP